MSRPVAPLGVTVAVATIGGLLFGYDTGVVNGALAPLVADLAPQGRWGWSPAVVSGVVTSSLLLGAALGAGLGGRWAGRWGRRGALRVLALIFVVATVASALAPGLLGVVVARAALGVGVGGASIVVPMLLAEVAEARRRGSVVARNEFMIVFGQLLAFTVNAVLLTMLGGHPQVWRVMLAVAVVPALGLAVGLLRVPESPRWLVLAGRRDEALRVLRAWRGAGAEAELAAIESRTAAGTEQRESLRVGWVRRIVVIGCVLGVLQQTTGINSVMFYGSELLAQAGLDRGAALWLNIGNGVASVVGILLGMRWIERLPRRVMLIGGFVATTSMHVCLAATAALVPAGPTRAFVMLVPMTLFVLAMQGTIGPLTWLILSELFPLRLRGAAMGVCVLVLWLANAAVATVFPVAAAGLGMAGSFAVFAVIGVASVLFVRACVPETRGRTLEEIEATLRADPARSPVARAS